mgnify:CR=1 FL=1
MTLGRKKVGKYSMGMRQRLGIAQAIMENQSILILDEPMNGLDNKGVDEIRKLILDLKNEGRSIILASHNREGGERTGAAGARSSPFPEGNGLPGSLVVQPVQCQQGERDHRRTSSPFIKALQCSQTSISPEKAGLRPPPGCYLPDS